MFGYTFCKIAQPQRRPLKHSMWNMGLSCHPKKSKRVKIKTKKRKNLINEQRGQDCVTNERRTEHKFQITAFFVQLNFLLFSIFIFLSIFVFSIWWMPFSIFLSSLAGSDVMIYDNETFEKDSMLAYLHFDLSKRTFSLTGSLSVLMNWLHNQFTWKWIQYVDT